MVAGLLGAELPPHQHPARHPRHAVPEADQRRVQQLRLLVAVAAVLRPAAAVLSSPVSKLWCNPHTYSPKPVHVTNTETNTIFLMQILFAHCSVRFVINNGVTRRWKVVRICNLNSCSKVHSMKCTICCILEV